MPAPIMPNRRINPTIHHRNHAGRVPQKRAPPRNAVQHAIQPQLRRRPRRALPQPLHHAPRAPQSQRREIRDAGAVAEIVGPAARGQGGARAGQVGEGGFFEGEVVEGLGVEAREGVELGGVREGGGGEEGGDVLGGCRVEGLEGGGCGWVVEGFGGGGGGGGVGGAPFAGEGFPDGHGEVGLGGRGSGGGW